ncbi:MAG: protein translocase subunit yajC [Rickettsiaceae bacterium]|jgi:preprotein translocase subunit YajC|nr:protein translocase subunit yajC [Rickettsiaceae bacterium]
MLFISDAFAQSAPAAGEPGLVANLLPLLLIFVVFYFLLIRPQQQKLKAHGALVEALKKGDEVITAGGILGKVVKAEEDKILHVEIANDVVIRVNRSAVTDVLNKKEEVKTPAKKNSAKKKQRD